MAPQGTQGERAQGIHSACKRARRRARWRIAVLLLLLASTSTVVATDGKARESVQDLCSGERDVACARPATDGQGPLPYPLRHSSDRYLCSMTD